MFAIPALLGVASGAIVGKYAAPLLKRKNSAPDIDYELRFRKRTELVLGIYGEVLRLAENSVSLMKAVEAKKPENEIHDILRNLDSSSYALKARYAPLAGLYLENTGISTQVREIIGLSSSIAASLRSYAGNPDPSSRKGIERDMASLLENYREAENRLSDVDMLLWI